MCIQKYLKQWAGPPGMMGTFFVTLFFAVLFANQKTLNLLRDGDTCWLIKTGEWILTHGTLPAHNVFGMTPDQQAVPWVCYQWLFEVMLGGAHLLGGLHGVVFLSAAFFALIPVVLIAWLYQRKFLGVPAILLPLFLTTLMLFLYNAARPYLVSYLLTAVLLWLLHQPLSSRMKWGILPLLFLLWANCHLGFVAGILILTIYTFCEVFKTQSKQPLLLLLACGLATLVNPYGIVLYAYLWDLGKSPYMNNNIVELQSMNFHTYPLLLPYVLLIIGSAVVAFRDIRITLAERICFFASLGLAFFSMRHLYLLMLFSLPMMAILVETLWAHFKSFLGKLEDWAWLFPPEREKPLFWIVGSLLLAGVMTSNQLFPAGFIEKQVLKGAIAYLQAHPIKEPILTTGQWGDYLLFYTSSRSFLDTRFDMYGDSWVGQVDRAYTFQGPWQRFFQKQQVHYVLYPAQAQLPRLILQKLYGWNVVFEDKQAVLMFGNVL